MSVFRRCVRWYCRYGISYRDLEEMMAERGVAVDHVTLYRWVQRYAPELIRPTRGFQSMKTAYATIMGLIPGLKTIFGLVPLYGHDVWLHALLAIIAAYFGFVARPEERAAAIGKP